MPRGYYLGQRLNPLGYHSSDDPDFDDGHWYGATNSPGFGPEKRRGTGAILPIRFMPPPGQTPTQVFLAKPDSSQRLDGACLDNGGANPRAGWAFVHGPGENGIPQIVSGRLESKGPFGDTSDQTSNRAELRAVIAALRFRHWPGEGFTSVVIATDSEYVVEGATQWVRSWVYWDWTTVQGHPVKNRDLWEMLLGEIEWWDAEGFCVRFWRIPREWNRSADGAARTAAARAANVPAWQDVWEWQFDHGQYFRNHG